MQDGRDCSAAYLDGGAEHMDIRPKDQLVMKKPHPCGCNEWEVLRIGVDFVIRCTGCGHRVMIPRPKFEKAVKKRLKCAGDESEKA